MKIQRCVQLPVLLAALAAAHSSHAASAVAREGPRQPPDPSLPEREREHAALIDNQYKHHQFSEGRFELYDLVRDRAETRDLAAEMPEVIKKMSAILQTWQRSVENSLKLHDYGRAAATSR